MLQFNDFYKGLLMAFLREAERGESMIGLNRYKLTSSTRHKFMRGNSMRLKFKWNSWHKRTVISSMLDLKSNGSWSNLQKAWMKYENWCFNYPTNTHGICSVCCGLNSSRTRAILDGTALLAALSGTRRYGQEAHYDEIRSMTVMVNWMLWHLSHSSDLCVSSWDMTQCSRCQMTRLSI